MAERVDELFAEYADAYARGEHPRSPEYLARAGHEADELAGLIDRFVAAAPAPRPDDAEIALMEAWLRNEPPLLELRVRRGLQREQVVDALISALGLSRGAREQVARYYHQLETGLLDVGRVDRRVWDALAEALQAAVPRPARSRPGLPRQVPAFYRADTSMAEPAAAAPQAPAAAEEPDDVDRLFTGRPSSG